MPTSPEELYRERATRFGLQAEQHARRFGQIANARLAAFAIAVLTAGTAIWRQLPILAIPALILFVAFAILVRHHGRLRRERDRAQLLQRINEESLHRLARDWDALPAPRPLEGQPDPDHPYAVDLDITGRASLLHLTDTTTSPMGAAALAGRLLHPPDPSTISERQAAARELAPMLEARQELQLRGRLTGDDRPDPEPFLRWCESGPWLGRRPLLRWAARISPLLPWIFLAAWAARLVPYPVWPLFFLANILFWLTAAVQADRILSEVRLQQGAVARYAGQLALLTTTELTTPALTTLQQTATAGGTDAARALDRLERLLSFAVPTSAPAHFVLQSLFLWNVHVLDALERWQRRSGAAARGWLAALGELEALAALAGLAHDNPTWAMPDVDTTATDVTATALGHPLIPAATRVDNDVSLGPPGTFLLVTGSNMSGKSTLLRAIGVNAVLAQAGAPACATALRLPPLRLWTSMRIVDSLEHGVSYFLAELRRLKQLVDTARTSTARDATICWLLDEMLQGTNTAERQVAARHILTHLAARGTLGAVSTHDLTLADTPELTAIATRVHLRETIAVRDGRPEMTFDYRLRPGPATSTNALRLMQAMGLMDE